MSERWSPRRAVAFWVACSLAFWIGAAFALLYLIPSVARPRPPRAWERVNTQVNTLDRRFTTPDRRGDNDGVFDCEDYAWTKYDELQALGVSPNDMNLYAVTVANGTRHMILVAKGWVLDNLEPRIEPEAKARRYYSDWEYRSPKPTVIRIQ